jgi:hypothetical protein
MLICLFATKTQFDVCLHEFIGNCKRNVNNKLQIKANKAYGGKGMILEK